MKFFTPAKLGPTRSKTPEGFLVCEAVRVARTGEMLYGPDELGLEPGPDGVVRLYRDSADLFAADAMASFEGKPVLGEHTEATPANWAELAWGHMQNVRAGTGADAGYMLADLVVNRPDGIAAIEAGREEVSLFYDFDFVPTAKGAGRQTNIRGNHVAVVEAGRCGPTCRIGDHQPTKRNPLMKLPFWGKAAAAALKAGDEETAAELLAEGMKAKAADADPIAATLARIEAGQATLMKGLVLAGQGKRFKLGDSGEVEEDKESGDEDDDDKDKAGDEDDDDKDKAGDEDDEDYEKMKSGDSGRAALRAEWQSVISQAEILAPGCPTRLPAFDSLAASGIKRVRAIRDSMCRCRRAAMDHALMTDQGRAILAPLLRGRAMDAIDCGEQSMIFHSAAEIARAQNNSRIHAGDATEAFYIPDAGSLYQSMYGRH